MNFTFSMPTRVRFGRGCLAEHGGDLAPLGRHAFVVTGKSSASNGALGDVLAALRANGQDATVYDRVRPNPGEDCVREGTALLVASGADFVVGVGGGSPMDAAKAIALLARSPRQDLFAGGGEECALPTAQVPTTAGTGSEVTPYAVLTDGRAETKRSISSPALFARVAFLDGRYTETLTAAGTVNPALDAFSHAAESLLSRRATPLSRALAEESLRILYPRLPSAEEVPSSETRDALLYASMLAGMAIAQSGTTLVHGMGYSLTYFHGVDHGRANALLLGETLLFCRDKRVPELALVERACGADAAAVAARLSELLGERERIPREKLLLYAERALSNKNRKQSVYEPDLGGIERIFLRSFPQED